jgi:uncharacterized membrane protein YbhN (UPF0104 family)
VSDIHEFINASQAFFNRLGDVKTGPLAIALVFHTANLLLRTRAWYAILRAAYPNARNYRWRSCAGAYLSGVGLNALIPARGGDLLKLYLVRLRLPESRIATVAATLLVETLLDTFIGPALFIYAYTQGVVPRLPDLPHLPAFELSLAVRHPRATGLIVAALVLLGLLLLRHAMKVARDFRERVRQGFTILHQPRRFAIQVVFPQALGWLCRVGTMFYMLRAFSIHADIRNALLVLVVGSVSTLLPLTPGGVGTQQALIVVVLSGQAPDSVLLSFSVGMQFIITLANALLGFIALALMLRSLSLRKAIRDARAHHASDSQPSESS